MGWLMCILCWIGYSITKDSNVLIAGGLFAVAGTIGLNLGSGIRIKPNNESSNQ